MAYSIFILRSTAVCISVDISCEHYFSATLSELHETSQELIPSLVVHIVTMLYWDITWICFKWVILKCVITVSGCRLGIITSFNDMSSFVSFSLYNTETVDEIWDKLWGSSSELLSHVCNHCWLEQNPCQIFLVMNLSTASFDNLWKSP